MTRAASRPSRAFLATLGAISLVVLMAYLDYRTGPDVAFSVSYLVPILLAASQGPAWAGVLVALLSSLARTAAQIYEGSGAGTLVLLWNVFSQFLLFVTVALLIASLRRQLERATEQARTDSLTGVLRRGAFMEVLEAELERVARYPAPLSLAYIDVDDFKAINDSYGHAGGDRALRAVADELRQGARRSDSIARMGGDEFVLLMPETTESEARTTVERLRAALGERLTAEGLAGRAGAATMSMGLVTFLAADVSAEVAIQRVDELMYEVKRSGKNGYRQAVLGAAAHT